MARAPTPPIARNTVRVGPNDRGATRTYRPGENASPAAVSHAESSGLLREGDAARGEYNAESRRAASDMANRIADLGRSEGASGQVGRDAASGHGVSDYLTTD